MPTNEENNRLKAVISTKDQKIIELKTQLGATNYLKDKRIEEYKEVIAQYKTLLIESEKAFKHIEKELETLHLIIVNYQTREIKNIIREVLK